MNSVIAKNIKNQSDIIFWGFTAISLVSILIATLNYSIFPLFIPVAIIGLYIAILDLKFVYLCLIGILAFSTEVNLPGGIGTDLPGEPIMIFLTGIYFLLLISNPSKHILPIGNVVTLLILLHVVWIAFTVIPSVNQTVSLKYLLAKIWYVIPFYFSTFIYIKDKRAIKQLFFVIIISVFVACFIVMAKHFSYNFAFDKIETSVQPIFRNHVNYACLLVITLPYFWLFYRWHHKTSFRFLLLFMVGFILTAIYFSFTRAAIGSVLIGIVAYFIIYFRLTILSFIASSIGVALLLLFMSHNNRFMEYAPQYEKTITHKQFDNLLEATAKGEDISTMERVYRWVAGVQMVAEKPLTGYGPSNFYPYYKEKTLSSFQTYVSHNPEHSGIHCYYLMVAVEQGLIGFLIFIALCFYILYEAEKTFHNIKDPFYKGVIAASYVSVVIILSILIVNDLLEADKVGPFFFLAASLIIISKRLASKESQESLLEN